MKTDSPELLSLIGRKLIVADYDNWRIAVVSPVEGRIEPAIGDYLKFLWSYLWFYSDGSPRKRRSKSSAFGSRLVQLAKRSLTRRLKPSQLFRAHSSKAD